MQGLHPILRRQLRKLGISSTQASPSAAAWPELLARISKGYSDADNDRYLVERSLEVSSSEMQALNKQLRDEVVDRQRAEAAARTAQGVAVAASQAKSAFLATMSHEIRSPLNAVIGMTDLLTDTPLSADQRLFVETIRTGGSSLLAIISDILDYSKIESGNLELEHIGFEVRECLEDAIEMVAQRAQVKGLELTCLVEPKVPRLALGDAARIRQVLVNLLSNAVKFTDHGEVRLEALASWRSGVCELHFAVIDTGIGIAPEHLDRLFHSFSQVDASTTRRYGGSGLGLAICKALCEKMGGRTWVESSPGRGSTFHATVNCGIAVAEDDFSCRAPTSALLLKRILIVDDNATNREVLRGQTASWGMLPTVASSGREALECLGAGEAFDLAILDMAMPEMDGVALARAIHALASCHTLPLVLLTSLRQLNDLASAPEGLFAAHLSKPTRHVQLRDALVRIVTQHAAARTALGPVEPQEPAPKLPARLKILLTEDMAVNRLVAMRMLERLGYTADVASNGAEAVDAVATRAYDLILMDMQMPVMDGLEATRRIRLQENGHRQPWIVAMTANAMVEDRQACFEAGMDDYLAKPVRTHDLQAALERAAAASSDR